MSLDKRGEGVFGMSFGVIFSIIVIIAIIGVAVYAIIYFLNLNTCTQIGLFYDALQKEIGEAWTSSIYNAPLNARLRESDIDAVCFGTLTQQPETTDDRNKQQELKSYSYEPKSNLFLLPPNKACDGELAAFVLEHIQTNRFFCVQGGEGTSKVALKKEVSDALVTLSKT